MSKSGRTKQQQIFAAYDIALSNTRREWRQVSLLLLVFYRLSVGNSKIRVSQIGEANELNPHTDLDQCNWPILQLTKWSRQRGWGTWQDLCHNLNVNTKIRGENQNHRSCASSSSTLTHSWYWWLMSRHYDGTLCDDDLFTLLRQICW